MYHKPIRGDYYFKVIIMGEQGVGKTSLLRGLGIWESDRFRFIPIPTSGVEIDIRERILEIEDKKVVLKIWDVGKLREDHYMYLKGVSGVIIVIDLTNNSSLGAIDSSLAIVKKAIKLEFENIPIILVGNKKDIIEERAVSYKNLNDFTKKNRMFRCLETSTITGENVRQVFESLSREMIERTEKNK